MKIKDIKRKKRLRLLLFLLIIIILLFQMPLNIVKNSINGVVLPFKIFFYKVSRGAKNTVDNIKNINLILEENNRLKSENYKLILENNNLKNVLEENNRLKEILNIKSEIKEDFVIAKVSFRDALSVYDEFFINKGSDDGIKEDSVVLYKNNLLGKVKKVYKTNSIVEMITKENIYTSVIIGEKNILAILKGAKSEILEIEDVTSDNNIKVGDKVYTSGISDIYKKGIYIGSVTRVEDKKNEFFKTIYVKIPFNIFEVYEVLVIK
ncbi:rod shape-determining protein MreC [Hypnocyclicus thermotrophus]|uniref:Cell shape-determining protein MreC n=1 Tax=Hypnocyclicus thermotrophus TaxID=1627895 RepID=A0AA46I5P2_9FUSO|nr:rod shape-determining protein MreC [Hypnocyclicus thermotrophus]TDT69150.1 rod shape-determining protein MreC [Hypnocyclicus thermotrophus]